MAANGANVGVNLGAMMSNHMVQKLFGVFIAGMIFSPIVTNILPSHRIDNHQTGLQPVITPELVTMAPNVPVSTIFGRPYTICFTIDPNLASSPPAPKHIISSLLGDDSDTINLKITDNLVSDEGQTYEQPNIAYSQVVSLLALVCLVIAWLGCLICNRPDASVPTVPVPDTPVPFAPVIIAPVTLPDGNILNIPGTQVAVDEETSPHIIQNQTVHSLLKQIIDAQKTLANSFKTELDKSKTSNTEKLEKITQLLQDADDAKILDKKHVEQVTQLTDMLDQTQQILVDANARNQQAVQDLKIKHAAELKTLQTEADERDKQRVLEGDQMSKDLEDEISDLEKRLRESEIQRKTDAEDTKRDHQEKLQAQERKSEAAETKREESERKLEDLRRQIDDAEVKRQQEAEEAQRKLAALEKSLKEAKDQHEKKPKTDEKKIKTVEDSPKKEEPVKTPLSFSSAGQELPPNTPRGPKSPKGRKILKPRGRASTRKPVDLSSGQAPPNVTFGQAPVTSVKQSDQDCNSVKLGDQDDQINIFAGTSNQSSAPIEQPDQAFNSSEFSSAPQQDDQLNAFSGTFDQLNAPLEQLGQDFNSFHLYDAPEQDDQFNDFSGTLDQFNDFPGTLGQANDFSGAFGQVSVFSGTLGQVNAPFEQLDQGFNSFQTYGVPQQDGQSNAFFGNPSFVFDQLPDASYQEDQTMNSSFLNMDIDTGTIDNVALDTISAPPTLPKASIDDSLIDPALFELNNRQKEAAEDTDVQMTEDVLAPPTLPEAPIDDFLIDPALPEPDNRQKETAEDSDAELLEVVLGLLNDDDTDWLTVGDGIESFGAPVDTPSSNDDNTEGTSNDEDANRLTIAEEIELFGAPVDNPSYDDNNNTEGVQSILFVFLPATARALQTSEHRPGQWRQGMLAPEIWSSTPWHTMATRTNNEATNEATSDQRSDQRPATSDYPPIPPFSDSQMSADDRSRLAELARTPFAPTP
ncbi:hypothetical protein K504DRAFT_502384 [Pleomassaria siparia CBS 279.74]|uniref:Uncharacterized protein n=1 Tax=Pleomassaria siparia CBS 279.74 TaxID=1314801 RepID=A0A6G1K9U2_9PLEO|nr:hypothetical protein K504DRAFT_502384 [Pleomassaria siparia CBS 279.74]